MSLISGNESKIFAKGVIGNVRKAQEDSHGWELGTPNGDLFVVCDGMGGHVGGAMASKIAVDSIIGYISAKRYATPIEALDGALQFANMQILGYANAHPEFRGMGTTACIVLMHDDGVWIAHVGDSRIYLYLGKEGSLHRITKDHSYVQTLVDAGEITDEQAEHHPNKNRIMKALGIKAELKPTFNPWGRPIHPKNGDIFLICSDGLSGMIPDRSIRQVLCEKLSLEQKGEKLIELAMQGETVVPGGQDNCTVELIEIDNSSWKTREFKSYNPGGEWRPPTPGGKGAKAILIAAAAALMLGIVAWLLWPGRYDKPIKRAGEVLTNTRTEYNRISDTTSKKFIVSEKDNEDIKQEKMKMRQMYEQDSIDPLRHQYEKDSVRREHLKKKQKGLQKFWQNIPPKRNQQNKDK